MKWLIKKKLNLKQKLKRDWNKNSLNQNGVLPLYIVIDLVQNIV